MNSVLVAIVALNLEATFVLGGGYPSIPMTQKEAMAVQELRASIQPKVPEKSPLFYYTRDDLYLVKWLRANSWNVSKADKDLVQHLEWRKEENIDKAELEDWSYFQTEYVIHACNVDRMGRPVSEMWLSDWNVRKAIVAGLGGRLSRWIIRMMEAQQRQLYEFRAKGRNVTEAVILVDMERYNVITTGCPRCMSTYDNFGLTWENHYPYLYEHIYMINSPPAFSMILVGMKSLMRPDTQQAVKSYWEKSLWMPILDAKIDRSQRSPRFGGTLTRPE